MERILENLKSKKNRSSTASNYLAIWRNFNKFVIQLDVKPQLWEDRASLFGAYLVDKGLQSSTLKSYFSAIKGTLIDDGYPWDDSKVLLGTLTKACKLVNDKVVTRLPIQDALVEMILFEFQRMFDKQPYLEILYKTMVITAYFGIFRVGEVANGQHPVKAKDVHIAKNKNKIMYILYTSKTHGYDSKPQKVTIAQTNMNDKELKRNAKCFFCPYMLSREYLALRGNYKQLDEPFFIYKDKSPVPPDQLRITLRAALQRLNL